MEGILDFLAANYIWFLVAAVILAFALIGFIADSKRKEKKQKQDNIEESVAPIAPAEVAVPNNIEQNNVNLENTTNVTPVAPVVDNTPVTSISEEAPVINESPVDLNINNNAMNFSAPVQPEVNNEPINTISEPINDMMDFNSMKSNDIVAPSENIEPVQQPEVNVEANPYVVPEATPTVETSNDIFGNNIEAPNTPNVEPVFGEPIEMPNNKDVIEEANMYDTPLMGNTEPIQNSFEVKSEEPIIDLNNNPNINNNINQTQENNDTSVNSN